MSIPKKYRWRIRVRDDGMFEVQVRKNFILFSVWKTIHVKFTHYEAEQALNVIRSRARNDKFTKYYE